MRSKFHSLVFAAAAFSSAAACSSSTGSETSVAPTHLSRVIGRVVSPSGTPLDSVEIAVDAGRPGYGYESVRAFTNANGEFNYEVRRLVAPASVPQPDTVHARVLVKSTRARDIVNGQAPTSSAGAVLTFVPFGQTPGTTSVQVTLTR